MRLRLFDYRGLNMSELTEIARAIQSLAAAMNFIGFVLLLMLFFKNMSR